MWGHCIYVCVQPGQLQARLVADRPQPAGPQWSAEHAALAHPRTLMGDYFAVQTLLRQAYAALLPRHWLTPAPVVIVHLLPEAQGGYTQVESRAFREAALRAGARKAWVLAQGAALSDAQALDFCRQGLLPAAVQRLPD